MNAITTSIQELILRDLDKLEKEISLYPTEESIWKVNGEITNPAGNLCLHLCGNLQHYLGAVLGSTGYIRHRDLEFSSKNIPRQKLIEEVHKAKEAVSRALQVFPIDQLEKEYPEKVFDKPMSNQHFFIHLVAHLGYHLGQVNYHRRLLAS